MAIAGHLRLHLERISNMSRFIRISQCLLNITGVVLSSLLLSITISYFLILDSAINTLYFAIYAGIIMSVILFIWVFLPSSFPTQCCRAWFLLPLLFILLCIGSGL